MLWLMHIQMFNQFSLHLAKVFDGRYRRSKCLIRVTHMVPPMYSSRGAYLLHSIWRNCYLFSKSDHSNDFDWPRAGLQCIWRHPV